MIVYKFNIIMMEQWEENKHKEREREGERDQILFVKFDEAYIIPLNNRLHESLIKTFYDNLNLQSKFSK